MKMEKAVLDQFGDVIAFVEVDKNVRSIEIAGQVKFVTETVETTDETWTNPDFQPTHFDRTFKEVDTSTVDTCINVKTFKVSANKKYFTKENMMQCDNVMIGRTKLGDEVYYF